MIEIKRDVYWTGIKDWDMKRFHGHELSTHRGTSYNSYLLDDEMPVLIDTVWDPYKEIFVEKLESDYGLDKIKAIVINHIEPDHGGSLGLLMSKIPETPIYCTKSGEEIIKRHFHKDWNFKTVKTGDTLKTGKHELVFVEMKMLHWPDSMLTYVKGKNLVFSNDAFGQHYSPSSLFNDEVDSCELYQEAIKYFANILAPFTPLIKKKVEEIKALNLPIDMIAPSHGVIWRDNPMQIVEKYYEWSQNYNDGTVAIIYDTMYNATKSMGEAIGKGLEKLNVKYKLFNSSICDQSDLLTEVFKAKGVIVGSCTVNNTHLRSIAGVLDEIKAHKFKGKYGAAYGSYGWSGEAHKIIHEELKKAGLEVELEPIAFKYTPTKQELMQCVDFGERFAKLLT